LYALVELLSERGIITIDEMEARQMAVAQRLTEQLRRKGIVYWDFGQPCLIQQDGGYCTHIDRAACACTIYNHRPAPCPGFDCRTDQRIWRDFEQMIPNPAIQHPDWPRCLSETAAALRDHEMSP
jgi:Fe-S-cluster containining protein